MPAQVDGDGMRAVDHDRCLPLPQSECPHQAVERVGHCRARTVEAKTLLPHQHSIEAWLTAAAEPAFSALCCAELVKRTSLHGDANVAA